MKKYIIGVISFCLILISLYFIFLDEDAKFSLAHEYNEINSNSVNLIKTVTISAAGDCTIGWDPRYGYSTRYDRYLHDNNNDYSYYFKNVKSVFENDDISIVNLEGQFTTSTDIQDKKFNFKAPLEYVNVLKEGSIEAVSFANNHSKDFGISGYNETLKVLSENDILYFGDSNYLIKEINGIKIGFFALLDIYGQKYDKVGKAIDYLKNENCDLIIVSIHWGIEGDYKQSDFQVKMGHFMIDRGVDLVIGHHPHLIQGIEKYKDRYILYSLGNFSFGGNQNPPDKDTYIFQQTFSFNNKEIINTNIDIIPASISSASNVNNYQPIVLTGNEKNRVYNKIMKYSVGL